MHMTSPLHYWIESGRSLLSRPPAIVNIHRLDTDNLGDRVCSPTLYFDFLHAVRRYDLLRVSTRVSRRARLILFGGGGLLDNDFFRRGWDNVLDVSTAEMIGWGLGHNRHGKHERSIPRLSGTLFVARTTRLRSRPSHIV